MSKLKYPKVTNTGLVVCQECGKAFKRITSPHLKLHDVSFGEYQIKYPDCPISDLQYKALMDNKDSTLFKENEQPEKDVVEPGIDYKDKSKLPPNTFLYLNGVPKNKADILEFLHPYYPHLINNFIVEKTRPSDGRLEYHYVTDMADPVRKVIFDFPKSFWHNDDFPPDHLKPGRLKDDGWIIITVDKHYPTIQDVELDSDIITE